MESYEALEPQLREAPAGLTVQLGGNEAIASDITERISEDIARAESITIPVCVAARS